MSEYDWETGRAPRPTSAEFLATLRPHHRAIAEYAALEHPRESLAWVLKRRP